MFYDTYGVEVGPPMNGSLAGPTAHAAEVGRQGHGSPGARLSNLRPPSSLSLVAFVDEDGYVQSWTRRPLAKMIG